jgi:GNAT superfamily N-acetyltransferase
VQLDCARIRGDDGGVETLECHTWRMHTRLAVSSETLELSSLAVASKRYWGYDDEFMELCRAELMVDEDDVDAGLVVVAEEEIGGLVGFYSLAESPRPELRMLFVAPVAIGRGVGKILMNDALRVARSRGWKALVIESDPFAASFYEHLGAELVGTSLSASTGRTLPLYEIRTE